MKKENKKQRENMKDPNWEGKRRLRLLWIKQTVKGIKGIFNATTEHI
jgi:hypothetical protein